MDKSKIEFSKRQSAFVILKGYCHLAGEDDYVEVTEWTNGEGVDVTVSSGVGNRAIEITYGEFDAIKKLIKKLSKWVGE